MVSTSQMPTNKGRDGRNQDVHCPFSSNKSPLSATDPPTHSISSQTTLAGGKKALARERIKKPSGFDLRQWGIGQDRISKKFQRQNPGSSPSADTFVVFRYSSMTFHLFKLSIKTTARGLRIPEERWRLSFSYWPRRLKKKLGNKRNNTETILLLLLTKKNSIHHARIRSSDDYCVISGAKDATEECQG